MSATLAAALLAELDDAALDAFAQRLAPRLSYALATTDGWLRGAGNIATYIDAPKSRVYALSSAGRIAVERDGTTLIARKSDLDAWVRSGGAKRP